MSSEPTFNFVREQVIEYCNKKETIDDQLRYLNYVLKEKKNNPPEIDENVGLKPSFEEYIETEIEYRKTLLESNNRADKNVAGIVKITAKYGLADITRIFEAMKEAEIISKITEVSQIANIFFAGTTGQNDFIKKYNATKGDIKNKETKSNSNELLEFIKILTTNSFAGKKEYLEKLRNHIYELQKNLI